MSSHVIYKNIDTSIEDIIRIMIRNNVSSIVVMDNGIAKGIITERDIVRNLINVNLADPASKIMNSPVISVSPDDTMQDAADTMV